MTDILKTKKQAERYAARIKELTGKTHIIFRVPLGSAAYIVGYRWGTCEESERESYGI